MKKTNSRKKEIIFMIALGIIIISIIFIINFQNSNPINNNSTENNSQEQTEELMKCISANSKIIVSSTCGYCAKQKELLKPYLNEFEIIYIDENPSILEKYNIEGVPTWIINEKIYEGYKTLNKLKELTGC